MMAKVEEEIHGGSAETEGESKLESGNSDRGCCSLRGIQWRIKLGVLRSNKSSIDELRRAAADGRRKYADLRRRFLVDPHIMEDGQKTAHLNMDNPLSQDPESIWGRFFRNVELERNIDKDLTRLYPEHGSYFQTPSCQAMLRRILLVWSLAHSEHSYQQGMHELLAPLLYVLHVDVTHLSHVKHLFEDLSDERFDGLPFQEHNLNGNLEKQIKMSPVCRKVSSIAEEDRRLTDCSEEEILKCQTSMVKVNSIDELDPNVRAIFLGSDAYGVEGELGALLSGRFIEHDAYCMFDALLGGQGGLVAMADFFMNHPGVGSLSGLPPVIEASSGLYNLLAVTDISLYSHLVELHVEPQFFALRWLRVLFGREFVLRDLLLVWDAIFSAPSSQTSLAEDDNPANNIVHSPCSAFISAMAVSMLLELRSTLLASPDATTCLQRLLNFPRNTDVRKLIKNAMSLQPMITESTTPPSTKMTWNLDYTRTGKLVRSASASPIRSAMSCRGCVLQHQKPGSCSPDGIRVPLPESYWEEKWMTSVLEKVVPQESSNQEVVDRLGKSSSGEVSENIPTNSSSQQHHGSGSDSGKEKKKSRKKNCGRLLKSESESVANRMDDQKSGTSGKAVSCKLLDDQIKCLDTQIKSNVKNLPVANQNESDTASMDKMLGPPIQSDVEKQLLDAKDVQSNEKNVTGLTDENQCEEIQSEDQLMGHAICSKSIEGVNPENILGQEADNFSVSTNIRIKQQNSGQLVSASQTLPVTKSEAERVSEWDANGVNKTEVGAQDQVKMPNESVDRNNGLSEEKYCVQSLDCALKGSSGKAVTDNASQTGGVSAFWKKQKASSAANNGRFRWMWNFGRIIPGAKINSEVPKGELSANQIDSSWKNRLSEENNVNCARKTDVEVPKDECTTENVDSDGRKSEENNLSPGGKATEECSTDELTKNNIDWDGEKKFPPEISSSEKKANSELKDENPANSTDSDGRGPLKESDALPNIAESALPSMQLASRKDDADACCNAYDKGTHMVNRSAVSDAPCCPKESASYLIGDSPSVNLRIIGQSMLEKIQVLESALLGDLMLEKDAAAFSALMDLREIGNKLLQM